MQQKFYILAAIMLISITATQAQTNVGVNTNTPDASAALDVSSTNQGMLVPRMTASQKGLIATPATGLLVYQTDAPAGFYFYDGTAWTSLSGGGSSLPTQTGNAGKVLTTDGTTASWANQTYPNVELRVTKTASQTLVATDNTIAQTTSGEAVVYSATNDTHAGLTGGNTWDGTTFTVGSTGAGWYQLTSQLMATNNIANQVISMLIEINNTSASSIYGTVSYWLGNIALPGFHIRSVATGVVYLSAGDVIKIKAKGSAPTAALALRTDGSTYFSVVRLK